MDRLAAAGRDVKTPHVFGFVQATREEKDEMDLWLVLFWTGPIGLGIFLAGLGVLFWGMAQDRKSKKNE
jgi:hypothetical protein